MTFIVAWAILLSIIIGALLTIREQPHDPVQERIDFMNSRKNNR